MVCYLHRETGMAGQLESLDRGFEWRLCYAFMRKLKGELLACQSNRLQWAMRFFPGDQASGMGC